MPQLVYAISTAGAARGAYSTETVWNQPNYLITGVAPGTYFVYSTRRSVASTTDGKVIGALYSTYVKCGLGAGCSSHTPLEVIVTAGQTAAADPIDWYVPDGKVPAPPPSVVPTDSGLITPAAAYDSAREAATALTRQSEDVLLVEEMQECPPGRACISIGIEHDGTSAAYFIGAGGSVAAQVPCGAYAFKDADGWHGLRHSCGGMYPVIGNWGHVFLGLGATGCANFRSAPGAAGKVLGCLPAGTLVKVNMEPVYSKFVGTDGVWWHLYSHGWMADDFLR